MIKAIIKNIVMIFALYIVLDMIGLTEYIYPTILFSIVSLIHRGILTKNNRWSIFLADITFMGLILLRVVIEAQELQGQHSLFDGSIIPPEYLEMGRLVSLQEILIVVYLVCLVKALITCVIDKSRKRKLKREKKQKDKGTIPVGEVAIEEG